jgi:hypothetical protein
MCRSQKISGFCVFTVVAILALTIAFPTVVQAQLHGVGIQKGQVGCLGVDPNKPVAHEGESATVTIQVVNLDTAGHAIRIDEIRDTVFHTSGSVTTPNLLGAPVTLPSIGSAVSVTYTYVIQLGDPDTLIDSAIANGVDLGTGLAVNATTQFQITVLKPCIDVTKNCNNAVGPNSSITFSGVVTNCGNTTLTNVTVNDFVNGATATVLGPITLGPGATSSYSGNYVPQTCGTTTDVVTASGTDLGGSCAKTVVDTASSTCSLNTLLTCTINPNTRSICAGTTGVFTAVPVNGQPGFTITWTGPGTFSATGASITVGTAGVYTANIVDSKGCSTSCQATLTVNNLPTVTVNSATICVGESATLTATTNAASPSFSWSPGGQTTQSIVVTTAGSYTVTVTNGITLCQKSATGTLTVNPLPECSISNNGPFCPRSTNTHGGPAGMATYSWSIVGNGTISGAANAQTVTVTAGTLCSNVYTLTLTVTNIFNCSSTCQKVVLVEDKTPPTIICPPDIPLVSCFADVPQPNTASVTASDNCGGTVTVTFVGDSTLEDICEGTISRVYQATDLCGNTATCTQRIFVSDGIPPVITKCPANVTVQCVRDIPPPNTASVTATDNCGTVTVTWEGDSTLTSPCGGTITRIYRATDYCGNSVSCGQRITVRDTTPPVLTCPPDKQLQCGESSSPANTGTATATDNCEGAVVICFRDVITQANCTGREGVDRIWIATDFCGNTSSCTQHITYAVDTTPPVITCPPNRTLAIGELPDPNITGSATATDNCSGCLSVCFADTVGSATINRVWTATDRCGNSASCTQTITLAQNPCGVSGLPDLVIQSLTLNKSTYAPGEVGTATIVVKNHGSASTGTGYVVDIYRQLASNSPTVGCNASFYRRSTRPILAAGSTDTFTLSFTNFSVAGSYVIRTFADSTCTVLETNEANNQATANLSVVAPQQGPTDTGTPTGQ